MENKDKQLLLKDLCARLPYETQVYIEALDDNRSMLYGGSGDDELDTMWIGVLQSGNPYHIIKPYLRPMSSMTEGEKEYRKKLINDIKTGANIDKLLDFYCSHHLDYRGLIEKGIAIKAPEGMYKTE